ncbi:protein PRR14L isoform X3 [Tyto alba]|uniref:protein PRR14L isoform X3 n=1 Tax=Tyto alba TaxID=56313 RepID=UPI001C6767F6|nr:protein PRR14L isoform X3 [Tyto alba]
MLSSGVESLLDSSLSAVIEGLDTGLPESISAEFMAVSEPDVGLDAKSDVSTPVLAHSDSLSAEHQRTSRVENFCQKTEDSGDMLKVISHGLAESLTEELPEAEGLEEDEKNKKRNFRKLDCSGDGYQKEDKAARGAEEYRPECCALTPGESWSKQGDPHLNQHGVKSSRPCCTEIAGSLKNTEENQANVQVTAETLPKLTGEVQGMKADGTRIFSRAGYRNDRVSKDLPPENSECPDVDTVMARAGVSETSMLDFLEPLTDVESATEHPQETNEYNVLKTHTAMPLRTGSNSVSVLETREEKLPRQNPINEFSTSLANCQTYQQDEENKACDFCTDPIPKCNEPHRLSSAKSYRRRSTKSSEVLCSILKHVCYLDFRNMPLENSSIAVHEIISETPKIESQIHYDRGSGFVENQTSTSVPVEQISVVGSEGLSSAKIDHREVSASIGKSYSSEFEEAAEVQKKIAVRDNVEVHSWPEAQEVANSEHCHSSVFSSVSSSPEDFSKEKCKMVPSEGGPKKRELGTSEKKEVSSLAANPPERSASICDRCPLFNNMNIQTRHASQTEKTIHPMENQCLVCQSEFDGPVPDSKQHLESLNKQLTTGLQTVATSVEEAKISICSSQSEERLLKTGDNLPSLVHKYVREDSFQGTLKENVVDLDSLNGVRNEDCSGYMGFVSDLIEEKTITLKEHNRYERECKGTPEESFSDSKSHCSPHACFIRCAKEKAKPVLAGNKMQQSLPKMKLVEDQENTVSARFLPFSSIHGSLLYKPENMNVLSETENKKSLRIKSILNNSCLQLTFEPGKETDAQKGIGPFHFRKFDIQESFNEARVDSETLSALNLGVSLPEKEKLCKSSENTQLNNHGMSSSEVFSKDSSVTKPLSVTMSVKRKASNTEVPSSENETATCFLNGAKSSRVCTHSKESLRDEGRSMITVKDTAVTSTKSTHCGEKFKNACVEKKMGREIAPRKKLPIDSDCLWALLEDSEESESKIAPLSTENYGKVLEEIPRSNLNNLSKERKNDTRLTKLAATSLLSETVCDSQAEDASDAGNSPELQYNTTPTFYPRMSILSNSCKESSPNCVVCSEIYVPYKLNAQSKDNVKEITEGQDTIPTHSVCKEDEALGSGRRDQIEKCQVLKRKKYKKVEVHLSDKAQQEQKSEYQEKAKITSQPSMLRSSQLLCSSSNALVTSRNTKSEGPSEEIFAVGSSENKLCSTLQELKRPKITTDIINSEFLKIQESEMENLNLNLGYDGIPGAFGTTNKLRGPLPLKRQPGRTCKKVPTSYQLKPVRKSKNVKSSSFFEIAPETLPKQGNTLLKSLYFPCKPPIVGMETATRFVHMPRQRAKRCSLLNSLKFRKCTKEPALLSKLSAMASKLLAPAKSIHNLEPLPYSSEILPVGERYSQRRSKNLLEAFSCINRNLLSRWADSWCTKMFSFQPLALYPVESTKILLSDLSHKPPTSFLDTPVFPISFHIKLESSPVTDLTGITSQHSGHHRLVLGEMPAPPSEWTFSFLLSQSCSDTTAFKKDSSLNDELHSSLSVTTSRTVALHPDRGRNAIADRRRSCSMLGLHTVLALSSPGCYRIWTRRRNLTSHIPTIQRLFISQFAQGLKGARYPTSVSDDLVSSLPYSLGRVLSIWSQHGPSACSSTITPLHSNHCKWQPSVGIESSYAILPHLPVQSMEALQTAGHEIRLETSFPLLLPKSCSLPESSPSPSRLSASQLQVHALNEADASVPACLRSQDDAELKKTEPEKRPKKVSQIRIRKTVPKPNPNLTPMGLPKPKRLKKKEFSLEEIYTNKNYKSPPPARSLETIFEEPKEKNGRLISVSHQKRKRILEFQDFTLPRTRKTRGKIKAVGSFTRAKKAALQSAELDALLSQKLMDLEAFFAKEAEQERASSI